MITEYIFTLSPENDEYTGWSCAPLFHGYLMTSISNEDSQRLHLSELKPFSQSLVNKNGLLIWRVVLLNEYADNVFSPILNNCEKIYIEHKNINYNVNELKKNTIEYNDIFKNNYFKKENKKYVTLQFETPTAFRSEGKYIFYPELKFIYNSIIRKFDTFSEQMQLYDKDILYELINSTSISDYNIKSTFFSTDGVRIKSFVGKVTIKINGGQNFINFVNMLADYAGYCGIGIKNALGMGAVK